MNKPRLFKCLVFIAFLLALSLALHLMPLPSKEVINTINSLYPIAQKPFFYNLSGIINTCCFAFIFLAYIWLLTGFARGGLYALIVAIVLHVLNELISPAFFDLAYGVSGAIYDLRLLLQGVILAWLLLNPSIARDHAPQSIADFSTKKRYGFVSVWLYLWMAYLVLLFFASCNNFVSHLHQVNITTGILASINILIPFLAIISLIALLKWKKWGFFTHVIASVMGVVLNSYSMEVSIFIFSPLLLLAALYFILKAGKNNAWDQLD